MLYLEYSTLLSEDQGLENYLIQLSLKPWMPLFEEGGLLPMQGIQCVFQALSTGMNYQSLNKK